MRGVAKMINDEVEGANILPHVKLSTQIKLRGGVCSTYAVDDVMRM